MSFDEILYRLLGSIQPLADESIDGERLCNIEKYNDVLFFVVKELQEAAKWKDDKRSSAQRIGKECDEILLDLYEYLESRWKE